jgi:hypothetical protein
MFADREIVIRAINAGEVIGVAALLRRAAPAADLAMRVYIAGAVGEQNASGTVTSWPCGRSNRLTLTRRWRYVAGAWRPTRCGKFRLICLALGAAVLAGCASIAPPTPAGATLIQVALSEKPAGGFDLTADKGKLLFVEFVASATLTAELRQALEKSGYQLTKIRTLATVTYDLDGAFHALRPATSRTAEIRAGEFAEKPGRVLTKTGRGDSVALSLNPVVMILGTLFSNVGDRSGARDATNIAMAGDPDGKCLAKCDGWTYRQRAVISVLRTETGLTRTTSATGSIAANALQPAALFARCYVDLASATGMPLIHHFASLDKPD